jgi:hypothetical protein
LETTLGKPPEAVVLLANKQVWWENCFIKRDFECNSYFSPLFLEATGQSEEESDSHSTGVPLGRCKRRKEG